MKNNIEVELNNLGLNSDNAVVIGSGILNALNLRESGDIDVIVTKEKYQELLDSGRFTKEQNHGCEVLADGFLEIGTKWIVAGKIWEFADLLNHSTVIDGIRYNSIKFLLEVKRRWIADGEGRQKDINDVNLMEQYLSKLGNG